MNIFFLDIPFSNSYFYILVHVNSHRLWFFFLLPPLLFFNNEENYVFIYLMIFEQKIRRVSICPSHSHAPPLSIPPTR